MSFKKGESGNPNGRPLKAINKIARPIKEEITDFINKKFAELPGIWNKLSTRDKAHLLIDLIPYVTPKMAAVTVDADINFSKLTEDELDAIAFRLLNSKKHVKKN